MKRRKIRIVGTGPVYTNVGKNSRGRDPEGEKIKVGRRGGWWRLKKKSSHGWKP